MAIDPKKNECINVRVDEEFKTFLATLALDLGCTAADIVRTSVLLAADQIKRRPYLVERVRLDD